MARTSCRCSISSTTPVRINPALTNQHRRRNAAFEAFVQNKETRPPLCEVIYFSPRLKKWVTHRVTRPNRDKIIETWKCGNDPAFPVRAHSPQEQEQAA